MPYDKDDKYYPDAIHYMGYRPHEVDRMSHEKRDFMTRAERSGYNRREAESRWINERGDD
jgi:hypothetical protein